MKSIFDIIKEGQKNGKSCAEISAELAAAGYGTNVNGKKDGNAFVCLDESNREPCMVSDGKIVVGTANPMYTILYNGEEYHTAEDMVTLLEGPGVPDIQEREQLPREVDKTRHPEYAGRDDVVQETAIGKFRCSYDEDGYFHGAVRM